MGINLNKIKARQTALENKGKGGDQKNSFFWKPEEGEQLIRIVLPEDGDPFRDYWFHYDVAGESFLSPKRNFGEHCPLEVYIKALWKEGSDESKRVAKKLSAKQRFYVPIVVRGKEEEGVKVWGFGKKAYETLLGLFMNPEYRDMADPMEGVDLTIKYTKAAGASFPTTEIVPKRKSSKLLEDTAKARELLENIPDMDSMFDEMRRSSDQVAEILERYINGVSEVEETKSEQTESDEVGKAFKELQDED